MAKDRVERVRNRHPFKKNAVRQKKDWYVPEHGGTVTSMVFQVNNPTRCSLFIDGVFAFGIDAATLVKCGIKKGMHLDQARLLEIKELAEFGKAMEKAVRLLGRRAHSKKEIRRKLVAFPRSILNRVVEELSAKGLLDDVAFAKQFVRYRMSQKPRGLFFLKHELKQKGLATAESEQVLSSMHLEDKQEELARQAGEKKLARLKSGLETVKKRKKIFDFLIGQGFDMFLAQKMAGVLLDEQELLLRSGKKEKDED